MREVVCTGLALRSTLGDLHHTWKQLLAGHCGLTMEQPWPQLPLLPMGPLPTFPHTQLTPLAQDLTQALLQDSGWVTAPLPRDWAIVVGSSRAYQSQWETWASQGLDSPDPIAYWPHQVALTVAHTAQSTGAMLAPMAACATGLWAIARGYQMVAHGQAERAIVGAIETPLSPLTLVGFRQIGVLAAQGCYPFDRHRQGLALGEGGALLALETRAAAVARSAKIYGTIRGVGITNEGDRPYGVGGPAGLTAAQQCLAQAGWTASSLDYIHLHGTGTHQNDRYEAELVQYLCPQVWASGSKGAIGHTLGAAGAMGAALTLMALRQQLLPPHVGCPDPEYDLQLVPQVTPYPLRRALCWSFGFGGQNVVLALAAHPPEPD